MFKSKIDQTSYLFNFFAIRDKEYGGSIKNNMFEILHGGTEVTGVSGNYTEKGDKLNVELIVYSHMIYVFLGVFISYLIGFIVLYNYDSSQRLPLLIICGISFIVFPSWILYNFRRKVKTTLNDFKRAFLNQ